MDVKTYIQQQFASSHRQVDVVMQDLANEHFNWTPPGSISPMSAILVHLLGSEDFFIQGVLLGKTRSWDLGGFAAQIGVAEPPGPRSDWNEFKKLTVLIPPVLAYQQAVRAATGAYLAGISEAGLDRPVDFAGRKIPAGELLMISVVHTASHAGEMAAIKGIQGLKGLPF